jgi:hypothetical protein
MHKRNNQIQISEHMRNYWHVWYDLSYDVLELLVENNFFGASFKIINKN